MPVTMALQRMKLPHLSKFDGTHERTITVSPPEPTDSEAPVAPVLEQSLLQVAASENRSHWHILARHHRDDAAATGMMQPSHEPITDKLYAYDDSPSLSHARWHAKAEPVVRPFLPHDYS